jgi:nuclear cap-binding protein subunit 1
MRILTYSRVEDTELPDVHPKKAFIVDALDKEIRLSFAQRIKGVLPEQYQALISTEKEKEVPEFKFNDESVPFSSDAKELSQAVKRKASNEEVVAIMARIEEAASSSGLPNPRLASTDAYVQSICYIGSKSLSHAIAVIERCRDRLVEIASSSPEARKQIITSVLEHWRDQTGTGVAIVNRLLNYQILTPASVVEWVLIDHVDRGTLLARTWCYELVAKTCSKVVGRVHSLVGKIRDPMLIEDERQLLQKPLNQEVAAMRSLVEDACTSVAAGSEDGMIESSDQLRSEEEELLKAWGQKWVRVFRRRGAVEESWVKEELARPLPPKPEIKEIKNDVKMELDGQNGGDAKKLKVEETNNEDMDAIE